MDHSVLTVHGERGYEPFQPTLTGAGLQALGLSLVVVPACTALRGVVHSYLQIRAERATPYPVMPDGTQAVFISPDGSSIGGAYTRAREIPILRSGDYFGIRFYPAALRYFFDLDLAEITGLQVDACYLPCRDFSGLHHDIYRRQTVAERAEVCEQWLLRYFKPQSKGWFDQALALIYNSFGNIRVGRLAATVGRSSRHLNRQFRCYTGLSTQAFIQTIRIQHVCRQLYYRPQAALATALELGFFDQPHMLNDYKKRLLTSPGTLFDRFMSDFSNT